MAPPVPPAVPSVSAKEFLQAIWGNEAGIAELTIIGSKLRKGGFKVAYPFSYPESIDSFLTAANNHNRTDNVYMGVCLRKQPWPYPTGRKNPDGTDEMVKRGNEANALSAFTVWAEFDFAEAGHKGKTIPEAEARKALHEFPLKPSIINRSGGGIQCFWLTKELVTGKDLWHLKAVNRALAKFFNADTQSVDLARVLRIPWTKNYNYDPVRTVEIAWWHPEYRYLLDDFDFLPIDEERRNIGIPVSTPQPAAAPPAAAPAAASPSSSQVPQSTPKGEPTPSEAFAQAAGSPDAVLDPIDTPTVELKEEIIEELGKFVAQIWIEGARHDMALCMAGWFARTGVKESCAKRIVEIASRLNGGDTKKRLKDVEDTYKNLNLKPIKGKKHIEEIIQSKHPEGPVRNSYEKLLKSINTRLPRKRGQKREEQETDFKILHLTKFTSIPARWTVVIEKELNQYTTILDNSRFSRYETFVEDVLDQNSLALTANLKNHEWRGKIDEAIDNGLYEAKQAPLDSRPAGAIEQGLHEFLGESREKPDVGLLKKFAGHDEETSFFVLNTFRGYLEEQGHKFTQHQITEKLRDMGWDKKVRRFGKKVVNAWFKAIMQDGGGGGNGNGNGNGHPPGGGGPSPAPANPKVEVIKEPETVPASKEPDSSLFPDPGASNA